VLKESFRCFDAGSVPVSENAAGFFFGKQFVLIAEGDLF
jgi:hypothetical protein